jgi:hypothetical protein
LLTVLQTVWKGVRTWSRKALQKAGERVVDVHGEEEDDEEDADTEPADSDRDAETRETQ